MDKNHYINKSLILLSDNNTYNLLENPPSISTLQTEFNKKINEIANNIHNEEMKTLVKSKTSMKLPAMAYFYGSPKIHKPNCPLRPIIATCGTPQSRLAKWLSECLTPYLGKFSDAHLLHSTHFIETLRSKGDIPGKMLSLDVTALFTNIPLDDVLDFLVSKYEEGIFIPPIDIHLFIQLIRLCVDATIFSFEDRVYTQKSGVAMGSPLSPILANIYMEYFESVLLITIPEHLRPSLWVRYVDDIFAIYQHNDDAFQEFFDLLNNLSPSINFTVEWENNCVLPFLDVNVHRANFGFAFSVYRKPTHTDTYIHFYSHHSQQIKQSVVFNLFLRAHRICDPIHLDKELEYIKQAFQKLGYPQEFITKSLSNAKRTYYIGNNKNKDNNRPKCLKLPYSKALSPLKHITNSHQNSFNITFEYKNTLKNKFVRNSTSDRTNEDRGVYIVPCKDCPLVYVGETGRNISTRIEEHKQACRKGNPNSAIATHSLEHRVNFNDAKIICQSNSITKRRVIEGAIIHTVDTFPGNKAFSQEDYFTSKFICKESRIKIDTVRENAPCVAQQLSVATHSRPQVDQTNPGIIHRTEEINAQQGPYHQNRPPDRPLRRSRRIRQLDPD